MGYKYITVSDGFPKGNADGAAAINLLRPDRKGTGILAQKARRYCRRLLL